jgi:hypothetical protein
MIEFAPSTKHEMTYDEAILYCQFLEYNGHTDWRLPTQNEYRNQSAILGWYTDREIDAYFYYWTVTPVRDI